jgi:hypothetical protein
LSDKVDTYQGAALVNGWHVEVRDGRVCCMACGTTADMDVSRDCLCAPCREHLGDDSMVDAVAYAVWNTVDTLLCGCPSEVVTLAAEDGLRHVMQGPTVADVVRMAEQVCQRTAAHTTRSSS